MTPENFCYWLQGYFELAKTSSFNEEQTLLIKQHLDMVFAHAIDPSLGTPEHVDKLRTLHEGLETLKKELAAKATVGHSHREFDSTRRLTC
jgi:hypothetical protein